MIDVSTSSFHIGDCRQLLEELPDGCVQTCVSSPPYWSLRDYGHEGQIGLEPTPEAYVETIVGVFRQVRRVLRDDGTLWLNIGDSYAQGGRGGIGDASGLEGARQSQDESRRAREALPTGRRVPGGYKPKDLIGQPWMIAFALRADGWYLRCDIVWHKQNPQPESVLDRPTRSHEYLFLLSKSERYYYDAMAIREPVTGGAKDRGHGVNPKAQANVFGSRQNASWSAAVRSTTYKSGNRSRKKRKDAGGVGDDRTKSHQAYSVPWEDTDGFRNKRSVWTTVAEPYSGAHFATFPPSLIEPCILAGSRPGDLVLDPFFGSGTTGEVAEKHGRRWVGFDLGYGELAAQRTAQRSLVLTDAHVRSR